MGLKARVTVLLGIITLFGLAAPARPALADSVRLPGTLRDFRDTHPDFESYGGVDPGIVLPRLGADGKPVFDSRGRHPTVTSRASFDQWYRDVPSINREQAISLTLDNTITGDARVYRFDDQAFFPLDGQLFGNQGRIHNYHFTLELHSRFTYQRGDVFGQAMGQAGGVGVQHLGDTGDLGGGLGGFGGVLAGDQHVDVATAGQRSGDGVQGGGLDGGVVVFGHHENICECGHLFGSLRSLWLRSSAWSPAWRHRAP